ncbi:MAG: ABC transporter permease [Deltaproteobacteria bacterium]|nr:ABC transporter permease [Deltaproteobacteria bacterium]
MLRNIKELLTYRALVSTLVTRELNARYRGSVLGFFWTFLNPLLLTLVYSFVFDVAMRSNLSNYTYYVIAGLLPWLAFSGAVGSGCVSICDRRDLLSKTRLPAQILPLVTVLSNTANYLFGLPILFAFALIVQAPLGWPLLSLPLVVAVQIVVSHALALFLASANVFFRDLQHIIGNLLTLLFFLCPVVYQIRAVPKEYQFLFEWNPFAHMIGAYHDIFYYDRWPNFAALGALLGGAAIVLWLSNRYYDSRHEAFAELA